jgi:hypothetical protein
LFPGSRFTTRVRLPIMNRPAGFSAIAAANAAAGQFERAADRQRLVLVALEPFLDVKIEPGQPVVFVCHCVSTCA